MDACRHLCGYEPHQACPTNPQRKSPAWRVSRTATSHLLSPLAPKSLRISATPALVPAHSPNLVLETKENAKA